MTGLKPSRISSSPASSRRSPTRMPTGCGFVLSMPEGPPSAGRLRCAECAGRHEIGVCRAWHHNSGQEDHPRKGVIRGVESNGMLCSGAELELSDDHDGILDLPEEAPVGAAYAAWAFLDDPVVEINLLPTGGCRRHRRHRPRPRGSALGKLKKRGDRAGRGEFPVSSRVRSIRGESASRLSLCAAASSKAFAMAKSGVDAKAARGNRAAADQCARRYHQLPDFRPCPPASCLRRK